MIDERAQDIGIAEIHSQANGGISERAAVVVGHVHRVAQKVLIDLSSRIVEQQKVQLVNVKGV